MLLTVSIREIDVQHAGVMYAAYESAADWNRQNPPGTAVRITLRNGTALQGRTRGYATQWGAFAVVALEEHSGLFTAAALEPIASQ